MTKSDVKKDFEKRWKYMYDEKKVWKLSKNLIFPQLVPNPIGMEESSFPKRAVSMTDNFFGELN